MHHQTLACNLACDHNVCQDDEQRCTQVGASTTAHAKVAWKYDKRTTLHASTRVNAGGYQLGYQVEAGGRYRWSHNTSTGLGLAYGSQVRLISHFLDGPMDGATLSTGLKCMVPFSALLRLVQFICNTSSSVHLKIASQGLASGLSGSHSYHNWRTKDTACLTTPQITQCSGHVTRYLQVMIAKVLLTSSDPDALEVLLYIVLVETI